MGHGSKKSLQETIGTSVMSISAKTTSPPPGFCSAKDFVDLPMIPGLEGYKVSG